MNLLLSTLVAAALLLADKPPAAELPGVAVDLENRQLSLNAQIALRRGVLECVACSRGTKEHESLLVIEARPQHVHLGLLMLGLEPGRPTHWDEDGKAHPPQGPRIQVLVEYEQPGSSNEGKGPASKLEDRGEQSPISSESSRRHSVTDWIRDVESRKSVGHRNWVFAGSIVDEQGNYAADGDGAVVSVVNFSSSVIDLPQVRSDANAELNWEAFTERMPEAQTPVTLILKPLGASEPILLHLDKFGRLTLDRNRIMLGRLENELRQRVRDRPEVKVIIRIAAASLSHDLERLVETLHEIGVGDEQITVQTDPVHPDQGNKGPLEGPQDLAVFLTRQIARYQKTLADAHAQHKLVLQNLRAGAEDLRDKALLLEAYWRRQQREAERALRYLRNDRSTRETVAR